MTDSKGRKVCDVEIDGRGVDAFICAANYEDFTHPDGSHKVEDDELEYLQETYPEYVAEEAFQNAVGAAEYAYEGDR